MGRSQREKGKRGERQLATILRETFPEFADNVRRGWQSRAGDDDPDVMGLPGFWLESKVGKKQNPRAALAQAIEDSAGRGVPVAVIRDDHKKPFVTLLLTDFFKLVRAAMRLEDFNGSHSRSRREEVSGSGRRGGRYRLRFGSGRARTNSR